MVIYRAPNFSPPGSAVRPRRVHRRGSPLILRLRGRRARQAPWPACGRAASTTSIVFTVAAAHGLAARPQYVPRPPILFVPRFTARGSTSRFRDRMRRMTQPARPEFAPPSIPGPRLLSIVDEAAAATMFRASFAKTAQEAP